MIATGKLCLYNVKNKTLSTCTRIGIWYVYILGTKRPLQITLSRPLSDRMYVRMYVYYRYVRPVYICMYVLTFASLPDIPFHPQRTQRHSSQRAHNLVLVLVLIIWSGASLKITSALTPSLGS